MLPPDKLKAAYESWNLYRNPDAAAYIARSQFGTGSETSAPVPYRWATVFRSSSAEISRELDESWTCHICLSSENKNGHLTRCPDCKNVFHSLCIFKWCTHRPQNARFGARDKLIIKCPLCRNTSGAVCRKVKSSIAERVLFDGVPYKLFQDAAYRPSNTFEDIVHHAGRQYTGAHMLAAYISQQRYMVNHESLRLSLKDANELVEQMYTHARYERADDEHESVQRGTHILNGFTHKQVQYVYCRIIETFIYEYVLHGKVSESRRNNQITSDVSSPEGIDRLFIILILMPVALAHTRLLGERIQKPDSNIFWFMQELIRKLKSQLNRLALHRRSSGETREEDNFWAQFLLSGDVQGATQIKRVMHLAEKLLQDRLILEIAADFSTAWREKERASKTS